MHLQDLAESDLLLASDYAAHEAGFAAAQAVSVTQAAAEAVEMSLEIMSVCPGFTSQ